jgi:hypothetical protein
MATLKSTSQAHLASGRPAHVLADWLLNNLNQIDAGITRRLIYNCNNVINAPPDRRNFTDADNVG